MMKRLGFLMVAAVLSAGLCSGRVAEQKNVLFIVVDDMNDWIEPYGGHPQAQTPHMSAFAKHALVFKNAYCSAPLCLPSRTALLTGMRPTTSGVYNFHDEHFRRIDGGRFSDIATLPQHLRNHGYVAVKDGKIFHEGKNTNDPVSWNEFATHMGTRVPRHLTKPVDVHGMVFKKEHHNGKFGLWWGASAEDVLEKTGDGKGAEYIIDKMNELGPAEKPFFLAYGISKPHLPWFVPKEYFDAFPLETIQVPTLRENELQWLPYKGKSNQEHQVFLKHPGKYKEAVRAYLACLKFADDCVGKVLNALDESPWRDNTIVCIIGDHGWHLGEKWHWGKSTLWEESTKTPLMMYDPELGRNTGAVIDQVVSLQDLYPTLVDLTGTAPLPKHVEGRSFAPLIQNPDRSDWVGWALTSGVIDTNDLALRTDRWSLIRYRSPGNYIYELYDMQKDPLQHRNLAKVQKELVQQLSEDMDRIVAGKDPENLNIYE